MSVTVTQAGAQPGQNKRGTWAGAEHELLAGSRNWPKAPAAKSRRL